ncbi:MAG: TRAP transporter small permease subunit [Saprospiraceae bacterium]|nr:TRAP transporter small permease subunit [Bacteroidia bacterium]MBT8229256.1 TRAP transporter small permease subunit [Bacteroidia bacterium]NNF22964.1 TRAP transporter small permease subunit [Saprospiraceae bacterium]NNK89683.1 TRAP transporter small permease subunit [Saprospiraceae bacterium]
MLAFIKIVDNINEFIGKWVSWLTTILVIFVCFDVFRRYLLKDSAAWIMEMEWHLFALIFLFGAGYALKHHRHVRVDLFYEKFTNRDKAWVNLIGSLLFLIPWCCMIIYVSFDYAMNAYQINEGSPDPGGLPYRFIIKFSITFGFILLLLQAIALFFRSYLTITGKNEEL